MSDHPQSGRLEAVLTLPGTMVLDMLASLDKWCSELAEAQVVCQVSSERAILRAAHHEAAELRAELGWQVAEKRPYRYVVPLTPDEARVIDEEPNSGPGSTHP